MWECGTLLCTSTSSAPPSLSSLASFGEDIKPAPGVRAGRATAVADGLTDGARLVLGAAAFFGTTAPAPEARGRGVVADLAEAVDSGETTDARCGTPALAGAEEAVDEDSLPDVEADSVDDRAGGPVGFAGASDILRVGPGAEGVAVDGLGGMVAFEDGAEMDFFSAMGLDGGASFEVEEA
jgi:hypothetical protein